MSLDQFNELRARALDHDIAALAKLMSLALSKSFMTHRAREALATIGVNVTEAA
jgi:hypothetical protein